MTAADPPLSAAIAPLPPRTGMPLHFAIRIVSAGKDKITGEMQADERHLNAFGILHGGARMAFGDELGGLGARFHIPPGARTTTIESKTNFFRACAPGRVAGESVPLHVGRRMLVWQTSIYGPDGKRVALVTQTQLVLPAEGPRSE